MKLALRAPRVAGAVAAVALLCGGLVFAPAAQATGLTFQYDVNGSSYLPSINSTVQLGPAVITVTVDSTGHFTGSLPLPPAPTKFQALGLIPIQGTANFIPAAPLTGRLYNSPSNPRIQKVSSTAKYYLKLTDVTIAGVPTLVGDSCQTIKPVVIKAATPTNGRFDLTKGGPLTGVYTIGDFQNCGPLGVETPVINSMVPGTGNTVTLNLSNGRYVP